MGFRINTNIGAMNAHRNSVQTNLGLDKSLQRLSSGLRINTAADDASGLAIANQLKAQASGLGQAIRNANDGVGVAQTADGALEEYENIINTVRTKAIQAASDGQNVDSRKAIQADISKLLEEAQNIAKTTSFNGQNLLDGTFTDKAFHIGAYSNETVNISIGSAQTTQVGAHVNKEGNSVNDDTTSQAAALAADFAINGTTTGVSKTDTATGANTTAHDEGSAWAKAIAINGVEGKTGVHATAETTVTGTAAVTAGSIAAGDLTINGVDIGAVTVSNNDADNALINAINKVSNQTNVTASLDGGTLKLYAADGSDIVLGGANSTDAITHTGDNSSTIYNSGKLTLTSGNAVTISGTVTDTGLTATTYSTDSALNTVDVTSRSAAEDAIITTDFALKQLDAIRSNIGSTQNQLESTVRNISVTQVNVAAAESQIRDVDFAAESANFAKHNILAQSGTYAMSQANAVQQNVLRLLQ
ncbi:Flagellin [hydrothermal vent metagenome]|uniref:Flagellin n=1 Tax=hydrothermal vent metagenome TaxID=652676 RepID=A0A1W1CEW1_9ZZZZ